MTDHKELIKRADALLKGESCAKFDALNMVEELANALEAAQAQMQEAVAVEVKPLEWVSWDEKLNYPSTTVITDFGSWYKIDTSEARFGKGSFPVFYRQDCHSNFSRILDAETLESAKDAAQADYQRRILSAIITPASARDWLAQHDREIVERERERCAKIVDYRSPCLAAAIRAGGEQ